jgi:GNAT superfamily N-acetyltransferase
MDALPLRRAKASDAATVRELARAAYAKWVPVIGREPKPMTADYDHAVRAHRIDLYEETNEVVALIELVPELGWLLIENIAVRPDRHGQGLGDRLLRHAEAIARSLRLPEMRLYTNAAFTTNIAFYARRGFAVFLREPIPAGGEVVHMKKPVAPSRPG